MVTIAKLKTLPSPLKAYQFNILIDNNEDVSLACRKIKIELKSKSILLEMMEFQDLRVWYFLNKKLTSKFGIKLEFLDNNKRIIDYITPTVEISKVIQDLDYSNPESDIYKIHLKMI